MIYSAFPKVKSGAIVFLHTYNPSPSFRALCQWFPTFLYQDTSALIWKQNTFRVREQSFDLQKHSDRVVFVEIMKREGYLSVDK